MACPRWTLAKQEGEPGEDHSERSELLHLSCSVGSMRLLPECLAEHGDRYLIPNYQSNTDIFVWILRLQPNKLSINHRTNFVFEDDDFVDGILFCRIELLHLLLVVTFDCVEED